MTSFKLYTALICVTLTTLSQVVLAQHEPAAARSANYESAKASFREATIAYNDADYEHGRSLFERAHQLEPGAATWRALALCDYRLARYAHALRELRFALAESRPSRMLSETQQREALSLLKTIEARGGRLILERRPDQTVSVDGNVLTDSEQWLMAGEHSLTVSAKDGREQTERVMIVAGRVERLDTTLWLVEPKLLRRSIELVPVRDPSRELRAAGTTRAFIGLGAGGLTLAVGSVTGIMSIVQTRNETLRCIDAHCPSDRAEGLQHANTLANVANVSFGIAAIAIAYGLYELLTLPAADAQRASVVPTGTGVALHVPL